MNTELFVSENVEGLLTDAQMEPVAGGVAPLVAAVGWWLVRAAAVAIAEELLEEASRRM